MNSVFTENWKKVAWYLGVLIGVLIIVLVGPYLSSKTISNEDQRLLQQILELQRDGKIASLEDVRQTARIVSLELWRENAREFSGTNSETANGPVQKVEVNVGTTAAVEWQSKNADKLTREAAEVLVNAVRKTHQENKSWPTAIRSE